MTAVAMVEELQAKGQPVTDADLDQIRNICRCGTDARIRDAIKAGSIEMKVQKRQQHKPAKPHHKPTYRTDREHQGP